MKKLFSPPEYEYPKLKEKLSLYEREFLSAHKNLWKLMHENTRYDLLALARVKSRAAERRFWDFKEKTNHLPLGFIPSEW